MSGTAHAAWRHSNILVIISCCISVISILTVAAAATPRVIPVWPDLHIPAAQRHGPFIRKKINGYIALPPILWPTLTLFFAPDRKANGTALVICTGGGYQAEALSLEGYRVARWFNKQGVSCYVLKYRLPQQKLPPSGVPWALQDVRRAVQIVRAHAAQWHINPHHVGVMGFSAGGSLAALAGVHWRPGNPTARDTLNRFSTRPDFLVLGYPLLSMMPKRTNKVPCRNLLGKHAPLAVREYFSCELNVTPLTPPAFIFYAHDDNTVHHQVTQQFYAALRRDGVPAKLIEFKRGKHGFGLGRKGTDTVQWPEDCIRWLRKMNLLLPRNS